MRGKRFSVFTVLLAAMLFTAIPAAATPAPAGPQVNIIGGTPTTLPADTAFHVIHGWGLTPGVEGAIGRADFRLDVDGVDQKGTLQNAAPGPASLARLWLFNFDDGLPAGTYVLTGHWFLPCRTAVNNGLFAGPCDLPNEPIEVFTIPLTLTFT